MHLLCARHNTCGCSERERENEREKTGGGGVKIPKHSIWYSIKTSWTILPVSIYSPPLHQIPGFGFGFHTPVVCPEASLCLESSLTTSVPSSNPPTWPPCFCICSPPLPSCWHLAGADTALCCCQLSAFIPRVWTPEGRGQINFYISACNPSFQHIPVHTAGTWQMCAE